MPGCKAVPLLSVTPVSTQCQMTETSFLSLQLLGGKYIILPHAADCQDRTATSSDRACVMLQSLLIIVVKIYPERVKHERIPPVFLEGSECCCQQ